MKDLQIFNYNSAEVRMVVIDGVPWWVLKDVCDVLGLTNPSMIVDRLDEDERAKLNLGRQGETNIINESGLYNVIIRSDKPEAKLFKRWVTHEVLPSIRKHGGYLTPAKIEEALLNPDTIIQLATALKEEREKNVVLFVENEKQKQLIGELQPKADYVDYILSSIGVMATGQIAADYSLSARRLNKILYEERIQRKVGDQWILYAEHMGKGYTMSETIPIVRSDGQPDTKMFTKWTQRGRLMINEILNRRGIYANMDILKSA